MNHYERLKVSQDAPLEVIRAAYRALAAKHHPDRLSRTQPDAPHADMAALNAAYQVLADAAQRAAYDISLAKGMPTPPPPSGRRRHGRRAEADQAPSSDPFLSSQFQASMLNAARDAQNSRVDISWLTPPSIIPVSPWFKRKRLLPLLGLAVLGMVGAAAWWARQAVNQMEAERTLSSHFGVQAASQAMPGLQTAIRPLPANPADPDGLPSDEELLAEPPPLPGAIAPPTGLAARPSAIHPLDGSPLMLREEKLLVDPLAAP